MQEPSEKLVKQLRAFQEARKKKNSYVLSDLHVLKKEERFLICLCFGLVYLLMEYLANDTFTPNLKLICCVMLVTGLIFMAIDLKRKIKMVNFLIANEEVDIDKALGSSPEEDTAQSSPSES